MAQETFSQTLQAMGASDDDIAQAVQQQYQQPNHQQWPEIQPANYLIVALFFTVAKYFERAGMEATPICLDPVKVEARASKLTWYQQLDAPSMETLWYGLDVMENECLLAWQQQKAK